MEKNTRRLEDICNGSSFSLEIVGTTYCSLSVGKEIECAYLSKSEDHNNLRQCKYNSYQIALDECGGVAN